MAQVADPTLAAYNQFSVSKVGDFLESVLQVAMAADDLKQNQQLFNAVGCEGVAIERNCKSTRMCSRRQCFKESDIHHHAAPRPGQVLQQRKRWAAAAAAVAGADANAHPSQSYLIFCKQRAADSGLT